MNWKLHIFLPWFLEFVVVSCMYMLEPWTSLVPLILMTPLSIINTCIVLKIREKVENESE